MPNPKFVYLIVSHPDRSTVYEQGQPPATMAAYKHPIQGSDTIEATVRKHAIRLPLGSEVLVTTDARVDRWRVGVNLEQA